MTVGVREGGFEGSRDGKRMKSCVMIKGRREKVKILSRVRSIRDNECNFFFSISLLNVPLFRNFVCKLWRNFGAIASARCVILRLGGMQTAWRATVAFGWKVILDDFLKGVFWLVRFCEHMIFRLVYPSKICFRVEAAQKKYERITATFLSYLSSVILVFIL